MVIFYFLLLYYISDVFLYSLFDKSNESLTLRPEGTAGIARAIIKKPLLLLADEPVASLDPKAANLVMSLLKKINKEFNITVICNLHQVDLATKYSDRIVGLLDGEIKFDQLVSNVDKINIKHESITRDRIKGIDLDLYSYI